MGSHSNPSPPPLVRVLSTRTVKPPPRPRERIPLATWDVAMLSTDYIQKGLLYAHPPFSTPLLVDHLQAALADALVAYYPVAGRFATDQHPAAGGLCSVSIDCDGQGVDILHAVADAVSIADAVPPDADVPRLVQSFFPLDGAVNHDGHHLPLFVVQVTDLADGVFVAFAYNHALSDGTAFWDFLNVWAGIARARLSASEAFQFQPPLLERWSSPDGPLVLPFPDLTPLIERLSPPPLRERMLHFSADSLAALKDRARQELLAAGDEAGAAAVTRFQALSSLVWRCVTRARRLPPDQLTVCRAAINNRARLRPQLPHHYFGNTIYAISTEAVRAGDLLNRGHGWAAAAVGRAVAAHTDADIRARVAAWTVNPVLYTLRYFDPNGVMIGSSPRFDMYGCDFGWGTPLAARSGRANKSDGKASLYPGREGGGSMDAELVLTPENMARLEQDQEFWAAVTPDKQPCPPAAALEKN
ncbi:putative acetyltransferase [Dichanthelium oligosanthes]|uniref:Putative acetyltransferase n=1 Tax=Dichanthelium oligosanthes TaxID=888268 RepID=A0A1E5V9U2_9POAL|nr:putative acetyltransferase [Dichanthelium oligosanthes]